MQPPRQYKPHDGVNPIEFSQHTRRSPFSSTCETLKELYNGTAGVIANVASALAVTYIKSPAAVSAARIGSRLEFKPVETALDTDAPLNDNDAPYQAQTQKPSR